MCSNLVNNKKNFMSPQTVLPLLPFAWNLPSIVSTKYVKEFYKWCTTHFYWFKAHLSFENDISSSFGLLFIVIMASLVAQMVKNLPVMRTWVRSLGWEDTLEEGMATHSSILPGEFNGQRSLAGYSPGGHKESGMTEQLSIAQWCSFSRLWQRFCSWPNFSQAPEPSPRPSCKI